MFSNVTVAFLAAIGSGTWIYVKVLRATGNNTKTALIVGAMSGLFIFLAILMIMNALFKS